MTHLLKIGEHKMKRTPLLVFGYILLTAAAVSAAVPDPVKLDAGSISGVTLASGVRVFKGIPYAAPPVGPLRWRPPQPVAHWNGVRKAEEFGPRCMQGGAGGGRGGAQPATSEDCLYVN